MVMITPANKDDKDSLTISGTESGNLITIFFSVINANNLDTISPASNATKTPFVPK